MLGILPLVSEHDCMALGRMDRLSTQNLGTQQMSLNILRGSPLPAYQWSKNFISLVRFPQLVCIYHKGSRVCPWSPIFSSFELRNSTPQLHCFVFMPFSTMYSTLHANLSCVSGIAEATPTTHLVSTDMFQNVFNPYLLVHPVQSAARILYQSAHTSSR
jgi:hypothetical protein